MPDPDPLYAGFLGTWILLPESCRYEQGEPPRQGRYTIEERGGRLAFEIQWTDAEGEAHRVTFEGAPDGVPVPFAGSDLADELSVEAVSARDLRTAAYWRGRQHMVAQLQLDDTRTAMRVTQVVRFPDGMHLSNVSIYRRQLRS